MVIIQKSHDILIMVSDNYCINVFGFATMILEKKDKGKEVL